MSSFVARSIVSCVFGLTISVVVADVVLVPATFVPGTPALASEVNANFASLQNNINGNLDDSNLKSGGVGSSSLASNSILSSHLAADSVGSSEIAPGSVGSSELDEVVTFGVSGASGSVSCANGSAATKSNLSTNAQSGGYMEIRNEGNSGLAIQLTTPVSGDGGILSVFNPLGTTVVQLQPDGDIFKTGNVAFVHPHPHDPSKQIVYMALEGAERGTYCRGEAQLIGGRCEIAPPVDWQLVSSEQGITVQLTAAGECAGLYVESVSKNRLVVAEANRGGSNTRFYYQINGLRDGFENHVVLEENTMFLPEGDLESADDLPPGIVKALNSNGILAPDGRRNAALVERLKADALASSRASRLVPSPAVDAERK